MIYIGFRSYFFALTFSRTVLRSATTKGKKIRLCIKLYKRKKPITSCIEATGYIDYFRCITMPKYSVLKNKTNSDFSKFVLFPFGGEGEIRTLEPLLTVTRFPIVRARPATRLLRNCSASQMIFDCD